jgi:hypothetical protein
VKSGAQEDRKFVSGSPQNARQSAWIVIAMLAMVVIPAAIALHTVRSPGILQVDPNASPYGYTWSLLLFVVPIVVIAFWFLPAENVTIPKRAFWRTIAVLVPLGCLLDLIFAQWFFYFPNRTATLGINAPALGSPVPIEEYIFYATGFIAILLIYVWLDEFWLAAYNVPDYPGEARKLRRLLQFHPTSLIFGLALIIAAIAYKRFFAEDRSGFPGYFTVLVVGGMVPAVSFFPTARPFINWRAFSLTLFFIVLVSLLWEATLAIPYRWWAYQPKQMMGLYVGAWSKLPIEAVCVWIAVTYATAIVFEVVKLWQASDRKTKEMFFGTKRPHSPARQRLQEHP